MSNARHTAADRHGMAWRWISGLLTAGEIPSSMIIYVSVLMFLQLGGGPERATLYSSLLFLPVALLPLYGRLLLRLGHVSVQMYVVQAVLSGALVWLAWSFRACSALGMLGPLAVVAALGAWYRLLADVCFRRHVDARSRQLLSTPVLLARQASIVLTYGALIIVVGGQQVMLRQIRLAWSRGVLLMAVTLFVLWLLLFFMRRPEAVGRRPQSPSFPSSPIPWRQLLLLFLLLLPQSLLFYTRVLMLLGERQQGGLACTIQEVGFAQGTVGVLAFCLGDTLSRHLPFRRVAPVMALALGLSPAVYLFMTVFPPSGLPMLCVATFLAQCGFGLGLGVCRMPLRVLSPRAESSTAGIFHIPAVAACMMVPMACSGWLVRLMGYHHFFLMATLTVPLSWLALLWAGMKRRSVRPPLPD